MSLQQKMLSERDRLGWGLREAAGEMGVSHQSLMHLEGRKKDRDAPAGHWISIGTALKIVSTYWPAIALDDFLPGCPFEIVPKELD